MPILASRLQAQIASALDAGVGSSTGSNRYVWEYDYKYWINYAARKLLEWATTHQGSTKFNSEALRELRHLWVFQTSNYSRVEIPATINTITAVYPEITTSPTSPSLIGNDTEYTWSLSFPHDGPIGDTYSIIVNYNGISHEIFTEPSNIPQVVTVLDDYFNDVYGLDLGDTFDDYGSTITVTAASGTIYQDLTFKDIYGDVIATFTPTVTAYTTLYNWASFFRPDIIILDVVKDAKRITDEEKATQRNNVFEAGFEALSRTIKLYSYTEITNFNSLAYTPSPGRILKEIQLDPDRKRVFVAIALVENYTDVAATTDFVTLPEEFFNLMVEVSLLYARYKQDNDLLTTTLNQLLVNSIKNYGM